ncbi:MAG: HNH endonuclease family protein [Solirubrobacteraceae bacterium]
MSHLKQENVDIDLARDAFERILTLFKSSRANINVNKFLLHQWLSQYSYVSEAKLFRVIRSKIGPGQAQSYLDSLDSDARLYRAISEPDAPLRKWRKEERPVRESLKALAMFGVTQPLPMLLSLMRAYERDDIKLAALKRAVKAIEDFHFSFTAVASQPSSGGISSMYALHGRQLAAAKDSNARSQKIDSLIDKLREKRPSRELFIAGFQDLRASELYSQQKRLVTYILRRFHTERIGPPPDPDVMTLEHISNQGKATDSSLVAMVGNLLCVDLKLNGELGTKAFPAKREILAKASGVWVDDSVLRSERWTKAEIEARTIDLAEQAFDTLWAF